jgi:hypothetical protein
LASAAVDALDALLVPFGLLDALDQRLDATDFSPDSMALAHNDLAAYRKVPQTQRLDRRTYLF